MPKAKFYWSRQENFVLDVEFTLPDVGVTALFGKSGSGKTTILRCIAGLDKARGYFSMGERFWQSEKKFLPPYKRSVAYVFQEASLFEHLTIKKNLCFGPRNTEYIKSENAFEKISQLLNLSELLDRVPRELSGGERQRAAIARALLSKPDILLLDEPLSALDVSAKHSILKYLEEVKREYQIPMLYVSHDPEEVARIADEIILLDNGGVLAQGPTAEILTRLDLPFVEDENAISIIEGHISQIDNENKLIWVESYKDKFAVPPMKNGFIVGDKVRIRILARDVSLALDEHKDTSILNIVAVEIVTISQSGDGKVIVKTKLGSGRHLLAQITWYSVRALNLREGMRVYAQVKSVALV